MHPDFRLSCTSQRGCKPGLHLVTTGEYSAAPDARRSTAESALLLSPDFAAGVRVPLMMIIVCPMALSSLRRSLWAGCMSLVAFGGRHRRL